MKGRKPNLVAIDGGFAPGRCPASPAWLSAHAAAEWNRSAPQLHDRKLLTADTLASLENYCVSVGIVRECEELMCLEGRMVAAEDGRKPHPAFKMQSAAMREARLLAAELGLTPHRRGTKAKDEGGKGDGWSDLLA